MEDRSDDDHMSKDEEGEGTQCLETGMKTSFPDVRQDCEDEDLNDDENMTASLEKIACRADEFHGKIKQYVQGQTDNIKTLTNKNRVMLKKLNEYQERERNLLLKIETLESGVLNGGQELQQKGKGYNKMKKENNELNERDVEKERVISLQKEIDEKNKEIQRLQADCNELRTRRTTGETPLHSQPTIADSKGNEYNERERTLLQKIETLESDVQKGNQEIRQKNDENNKIKKEAIEVIELLKKENSELKRRDIERERDLSLQQEIDEKNKEIQRLQAECDDLKTRHVTKTTDDTLLHSDPSTADPRGNENSATERTLLLKIETLESEVQKGNQEIRQKNDQYSKMEGEARDEIELLRRENNELKRKDVVKERDISLQQEIDEKNREILRLQAECDELKTGHATKTTDDTLHHSDPSTADPIGNEYIERERNLLLKIENLDSDVRRGNQEIRQKNEQYNKMERDARDEIDLLRRENNELKRRDVERERDLSLQEEIDEKNKEILRLQAECDELKSGHVTAITEETLLRSQPSNAEPSETYKHSQLADRFLGLYENQWAVAMEDIQSKYSFIRDVDEKERKCSSVLMDILMDCKQFCVEEEKEQNAELREAFFRTRNTSEIFPEEMAKQLKEFKKYIAPKSVEYILEKFLKQPSAKIDLKYVPEFVQECVTICWLMVQHDPPLDFGPIAEHGHEFREDLYKVYTSSGTKVDFVVWPPLLLYENGPVIAKGVAQGMKESPTELKKLVVKKASFGPLEHDEYSDSNIFSRNQIQHKRYQQSHGYMQETISTKMRDQQTKDQLRRHVKHVPTQKQYEQYLYYMVHHGRSYAIEMLGYELFGICREYYLSRK